MVICATLKTSFIHWDNTQKNKNIKRTKKLVSSDAQYLCTLGKVPFDLQEITFNASRVL